MGIEIFANSASTTLNGSLTNSATSLIVTSATGFPTSGNFRLLIDSEILLVTGVSGTTFTVVRGMENTTAAAHTNGATVTHILTAGSFEQWASDRGLLGTSLADRKPTTPGAYDEEFEGTADTLPAGWSWSATPSGNDAFTLNSRWPSLLTIEGTGNTIYTMTKTFAPGAIDFGLWFKVYNSPCLTTDNPDVRVYIKDAAGNNGVGWEHYSLSNNNPQIRLLHIVSTAESVLNPGVNIGAGGGCMYGGMTRSSANVWRFWYSTNGLAWMHHATSGDNFTVGKITISFGTTTVKSFAGIDWLRYRTDLNFPRIN